MRPIVKSITAVSVIGSRSRRLDEYSGQTAKRITAAKWAYDSGTPSPSASGSRRCSSARSVLIT
jgi:hypothetical protein